MAEQDFSEIAKLSERYGKDPKSRIFVQLADAYRKSNMVDEALEVLKQGLQYHPQYPLAHLIQGRCFFDKRLYTQAKESFDKVIKFDPQNIIALRMIAQVCETLKDDAGQIAAFKGLLAVDPSDTTAQDKLNVLEAQQKKQSFFTITMAQEYERQGNLTEALKIYENLGFTDPSDLGIQERIRELKQKQSSVRKDEPPAEPKREEKVEGLEQFESYLKPHEIDFNNAPKTAPVEKAVISEMPETKTVEPASGIIEKTLETAPSENEFSAEPDVIKSDLISSVTDFMLQEAPSAAAQIEPMELKKEEPPAAEPKTPPVPPSGEFPAEPVADIAALSDLLTAEEPLPVVEEKPVVPPSEKQEAEMLSISDLLVEEPKPLIEAPSEITAAAPVVEPEPIATSVVESVAPAATTVVEPVAPAEEEVLSINDLLDVEPKAAETAAPPADEEREETKPVEIAPIAAAPETQPLEPAARETTKPPEIEQQSPTAEPESTEEPIKQKEEDFKSFQDWLSGLLK